MLIVSVQYQNDTLVEWCVNHVDTVIKCSVSDTVVKCSVSDTVVKCSVIQWQNVLIVVECCADTVIECVDCGRMLC